MSVVGTGLHVLSTTISGSAAFTQLLATAAFGPTGPDDLIAHGAYPLVLDTFENGTSIMAAVTIVAADFFSGASNISKSGSQVTIGQDSAVLGITAAVGQVAGKVPFAGPGLDTAINLAVNYYDFGRLFGFIPSVAEVHLEEFREVYVVLYP